MRSDIILCDPTESCLVGQNLVRSDRTLSGPTEPLTVSDLMSGSDKNFDNSKRGQHLFS